LWIALGILIRTNPSCRPLRAPRIALSRHPRISLVLDQLVQLIFSAQPRALPSRCRTGGFGSAAAHRRPRHIVSRASDWHRRHLFGFLYSASWLGGALPTAQDRDAGEAYGCRRRHRDSTPCSRFSSFFRAIERPSGRPCITQHQPCHDFQATSKACGGGDRRRRNVHPSPSSAAFSRADLKLRHRPVRSGQLSNLFADVILIVVPAFLLGPNGLFRGVAHGAPEPLTGTFIAPRRPVRLPAWLRVRADRGKCAAAFRCSRSPPPYINLSGPSATLASTACWR